MDTFITMRGERGLPTEVRRVLVLGASRSGLAAAQALSSRGYAVVLSDTSRRDQLDGLEVLAGRPQVELKLGEQGPDLLEGVDLVVKSPGIPSEMPLVRRARDTGLPVWSEIELGYRLLDNPLDAVTGTNGKTTTTALLGHMFATAGRPVRTVGNIGTALTTVVDDIDSSTEVVVEVSSFQLEDVHEFRPVTAILTNLTQDHLDRHGTMERYLEIKTRVFSRQAAGDTAVINADDALVAPVGRDLADRSPGPEVIWFSSSGRPEAQSRLEGEYLILFGRPSLRLEDLSLRGMHNVENCLAAASSALARGLELEAVEEALRDFPGVEHRLQRAGKIHDVEYVNDSKATNVEAALKALAAYPAGVHLILGGRDKASDYIPLARACIGACRVVYLIGEAGPLIRSAFEDVAGQGGGGALPELVEAGDMERAVSLAAAAAVPGEVVLLAPACASFDQYRNFEERGRHFMEIVARLAARSARWGQG